MGNKNVFAENLTKYMKLHRKTRRDVCNDLGFSYFTFTDWVKGRYYPRMDKVEMLANYFGIKKSDLIEAKKFEENPAAAAEFHVEILQDEDLMEMLGEYWGLDDRKKKIVNDLVHTLAETKTEA